MLIWTPRARADLKAIHDYIAKDSRENAKRVAREILHKTNTTLAEPPRPGRKLPLISRPAHHHVVIPKVQQRLPHQNAQY